MSTGTKKLDRALRRARARIKAVSRDHCREDGSSGASAEAIFDEARSALNAEDVGVFPKASRLQMAGNHRVWLFRVFEVSHAKQVRDVVYPWPVSQSGDFCDAYASALTRSLRYFLRDLLLISQERPEEPAAAQEPTGVLHDRNERPFVQPTAEQAEALGRMLARSKPPHQPPEETPGQLRKEIEALLISVPAHVEEKAREDIEGADEIRLRALRAALLSYQIKPEDNAQAAGDAGSSPAPTPPTLEIPPAPAAVGDPELKELREFEFDAKESVTPVGMSGGSPGALPNQASVQCSGGGESSVNGGECQGDSAGGEGVCVPVDPPANEPLRKVPCSACTGRLPCPATGPCGGSRFVTVEPKRKAITGELVGGQAEEGPEPYPEMSSDYRDSLNSGPDLEF